MSGNGWVKDDLSRMKPEAAFSLFQGYGGAGKQQGDAADDRGAFLVRPCKGCSGSVMESCIKNRPLEDRRERRESLAELQASPNP